MKKLILTFFTIALVAGMAVAQDTNTDNHKVTVKIPKIALLDIEKTGTSKDIELSIIKPGSPNFEAGSAPDFSATNSTLWLNVTSIVATGATRDITAAITGTLPTGLDLKVTAANSTTGLGIRGSSAGIKTLSTTAVSVITGIKSAYTLDGASKGYQLTYSIDVTDWDAIWAANYEVVVAYTLTGDF